MSNPNPKRRSAARLNPRWAGSPGPAPPRKELTMLKFSYRQTIRERVQAKCPRHPRYNPEKGGRDSIKGGCSSATRSVTYMRLGSDWMPLCASSPAMLGLGRASENGTGPSKSRRKASRSYRTYRCNCTHSQWSPRTSLAGPARGAAAPVHLNSFLHRHLNIFLAKYLAC